MIKKSTIRDLVMVVLMIGAALYVFTHPAEKYSSEEKINLAFFIPSNIADWKSVTHDTSDYTDKWQSINELLIRSYYKTTAGLNKSKVIPLDFILEYGSDLRKNFSFHFPENCHRASGNEVVFLDPLEIDLGEGKTINAKCLYIKGLKGSPEDFDKIVVYWLTIDNKQYYRTFFIKLNQILSGLLKRANKGFLVRIDYLEKITYSEKSIQKATKTIRGFIKDLYHSLDEQEQVMLFGVINKKENEERIPPLAEKLKVKMKAYS